MPKIRQGKSTLRPVPQPQGSEAAQDVVPPRLIEGRANPAYYKHKFQELNDRSEAHYAANGEFPKGLDTALRSLEREVALAGLDVKTLHDTRSDNDKAMDLVERLIETPGEIFEATEDEIKALETALDLADQYVKDDIEGRLRKAEREYSAVEALPKALLAGGRSSPESESSAGDAASETPASE